MSSSLDPFRSVPATFEEVEARIRHHPEIAALLDPEPLAINGEKWIRVLRSKADPTDLWAEEVPYGEAQWGLAKLLYYPITTDDPAAWVVQAEEVGYALRRGRR